MFGGGVQLLLYCTVGVTGVRERESGIGTSREGDTVQVCCAMCVKHVLLYLAVPG